MKNYELGLDEVVLYKGDVKPVDEKGEMQLILTNHNIIFITTYKKLFGKEEVVVEDYPIDEIKIYNGTPQLKANGNIVEIYLLTDDREVRFSSRNEIRKFINEVTTLLTHKTKAERCAEKIKKGIELVKNTVGEDNISAMKSVVTSGNIATTAKAIGKGAGMIGGLFKKNKSEK